MNLRKWITEYYTVFRAMELKPTTIRSYLSFLCNVPEDWEIETVTAYKLQKLINELAGRLSSSSVKHTFQIIREAIDNAYLIGIPVKYREFNRVKLPKMRKKIIRAPSDEELTRLNKELLQSDYADVYTVLLNTGLRFCELAGLSCSSFDPERMTIRVEQRYYRGNLDYGSKTDSGIRLLPISEKLKNIFLKQWLFKSPSEPPIPLQEKRKTVIQHNLIHEWHKICQRANLDVCRLHVLRHTFATKLLEADVSLKVVSAMLGHKSISVTADIYCDVTLLAKRAALATLEQSADCKKNPL